MQRLILTIFTIFPLFLPANQPDLDGVGVVSKSKEIMRAHITHKEMAPLIAERSLVNFIEHLDPGKVYFLREEIEGWLNPTEQLNTRVVRQFNDGTFAEYRKIFARMQEAIGRRKVIDRWVEAQPLPEGVSVKEFKDLEWTESEGELRNRLLRMRALRAEVTAKLDEEKQHLAKGRMKKRQETVEDDFFLPDPIERDRFFYSHVLKAITTALDAHTNYFTPQEAEQFLIGVQHRLFGIGAQLRDDLTGLTVVKIIEGGPAFREGKLKEDDRIIAVDKDPIVGMDIIDAVSLIRGPANTEVSLTVLREAKKGAGEEQLEITITRGEVVLKDMRVESSYQPFGDGVIGYVKLHSFYEDPLFSSAHDVTQEIQKLKKDHNLKGLILDLRYNSGGLLTQAVQVTGLFISKGVVVSIKESSGKVQRLRDTNPTSAWDGPLIILVNKLSASASEIVAQTLKDYGRAIVVGDERTFGKGSFQTLTISAAGSGKVNPQGEYKVTRGLYYTVSGKTPQYVGVASDVVVPGAFSEAEIGEPFAKWPLQTDQIDPSFDDNLEDVPVMYRPKIAQLYRFNLQPRLDEYKAYLELLQRNSAQRVENNKTYQKFLKLIRDEEDDEDEKDFEIGQIDLQLDEVYDVMRDLIFLRDTSDRGTVIVDGE